MYQGSCLCRQIPYELTAERGDFGYCHCVSCQKASGSAHAANAPIDRAHCRLRSGAERLRELESSPGLFRAFCTHCGSPLYAYRSANPNVLGIRLGTLDTLFAKQPQGHKYVAEKASWVPINDDLPPFPGHAAFHPAPGHEDG